MIKVTNIERFATHDGPGIRTTVFFKGCPLFCPWCANPETQSMEAELFHTKTKCTGCRECETVCPTKAISFSRDGEFQYQKERCIGCNSCQKNCLYDAIEFHGREMALEAIMEEVMKDKDYYDGSEGGGITVSGGEPFVQIDGLVELLKASKANGLNTAVETTGSYPLHILQRAEPYIDHYLYDFKHLDDVVLKTVTGGKGSHIKENLKYLLDKNADKVNVRMPIIPEFNYDPELIKETLRYLKELGAKKVNLLPYHTLGKIKYEKMGRDYLPKSKMLYEGNLEEFHQYALELGFESRIGA